MVHQSRMIERRINPSYKTKLSQQLRGASIILIVRIHRKKNVPKQMKKKLHQIGLFRTWDAVIIRNTQELRSILVEILPFITFGIPSKEAIRDLVLKRGRLRNSELGNKTGDQARTVIKSNVIVEKILGKYGIICIEDLIHVLSSDPKDIDEYEGLSGIDIFDGVANAINPFPLNTITIPIKGLRGPFNKYGYWGFRGTFINTFVEKII